MSSVVKMTFDMGVAKDVGSDAAIMFSNIQYWVYRNAANNKNLHDSKYWTYNSVSAWTEIFEWLSIRQIRTCLSKLVEGGYLIEGEYNKDSRDRTKWYTPTAQFCKLPNSKLHLSELTSGVVNSDSSYKEQIINTNNKLSTDTPLSEIEVNNPEVIESNTAVPDMPIDYMKANHMMLLNDAKMKASKHVREDWTRVEEYFNSVVLRDGIEYDGKKLYGRLLGLINNWKKDAAVSSEPKRKILK